MPMKMVGLNEFIGVLKENVTMDDVKRIVAQNGTDLERIMKMQTGKSYVKGYMTGTTGRSITKETRDGGMTVAVGACMDYNPYTEYGTRYMSAEPILDPSLELIRPMFIGDLDKITE